MQARRDVLRVRFAPSPTGPLHIGGARTALFNYLFAKKEGGLFILRIDDTDAERSHRDYEAEILESLTWLGLEWDEGPGRSCASGPAVFCRQSERIRQHQEAAARLVASGAAYADHHGVVRLRYPAHEIVVDDIVCGICRFQPQGLGPEPVLVRADGRPTYHLASVYDDLTMDITHIIRGQDHLTNSAKQVVLFEALGGCAPRFAHLPLILDEEGAKLSKRAGNGLSSISDFRRAGFLPQALLNYLMLLGWSDPQGREHLSLAEAVEVFSLERVSPASAQFEPARLRFLNRWWLKNLSLEEAAQRAAEHLGEYLPLVQERGESFWLNTVDALRGEVSQLDEFQAVGQDICSIAPEFSSAANEIIAAEKKHEVFARVVRRFAQAVREMPLEEDCDSLSRTQFQRILKMVKKDIQLESKTIAQYLRAALTGRLSGPELKILVPLIRRDVLLEKLDSALRLVS